MSDFLAGLATALPRLVEEGLQATVISFLGGAVVMVLVAVLLGLAQHQGPPWLRVAARIVVEFFRGTSLVVQLFFLFYAIPTLTGVDLGSTWTAILALGLNYGAYGAEVVRGSINSVPAGQWEATTALSMSRAQRMWRVIFPQAWALMIPSLNNLLIQLLKGTAIVGFITLFDLTVALDKLRIATDTFFYGLVGLVIYFVIAYVFTLAMNALEVHAKHRLGRGESLRDALRFRTPVTKGRTAA